METWFWILGWFLSLLTVTGNKLTIFLSSAHLQQTKSPHQNQRVYCFSRRGRFLCCS